MGEETPLVVPEIAWPVRWLTMHESEIATLRAELAATEDRCRRIGAGLTECVVAREHAQAVAEHYRQGLLRISSAESGRWGVVAHEALRSAPRRAPARER